MIRVAIADDHPLVLNGLQAMIDSHPDLQMAARAENGSKLIEEMHQHDVDVVLLDIDMPEMNGIETTAEIQKLFPKVRILILTIHDEKSFIQQLIQLGAHGYLLKNSSEEELLHAIRNVHEGRNPFSGKVTMKLIEPEMPPNDELKFLTEREVEVLSRIAAGKSNKEIGGELFISHRTVDTHRTNLMKKLDVHNIAGLIRIAYRNNLIQ